MKEAVGSRRKIEQKGVNSTRNTSRPRLKVILVLICEHSLTTAEKHALASSRTVIVIVD